MHIPTLKVWKLREPNVKQQFARFVTERKDEVFEAESVESKWNAMKEIWQKATEQVCGWTKGPLRHSETWWWNDEVAKAIEEKRRCYKIWHKTKTESDRNKYKEARRNARRSVALVQEKTRQELVNMSWRVQQERRMSTGLETKWQNCVKDANGKVLIENDQVKEECRKYMEKLLNENTWDNATTCENVEEPCELIRRDEILKALRLIKQLALQELCRKCIWQTKIVVWNG